MKYVYTMMHGQKTSK